MIILAAILSLLACTLLALSQRKHWKKVAGTELAVHASKAIRVCGWLLLVAAWVLCIIGEGVSFAALILPLLIATASFITALILGFQPKLLTPLAGVFKR